MRSTDKLTFPVWNKRNAHAHNFVGSDVSLLPILKTFAQLTAPCRLLAMLDIFSLCTVVEGFVARTNSSPLFPTLVNATDTPTFAEIIFSSVIYTSS
jgi:hypothetical protein